MNILIVEDSIRLNRTLADGFRKLGFIVDTTEDGSDGLQLALHQEYDAIVLDILLPGLDGLSVLKKLRHRNITTPVLLLSARDEVEDRVKGLNLGADDYLCKPFSFSELIARIQTIIRRSKGIKTSSFQIGPLCIDLALRKILVNDVDLVLTPKEYRLVEMLAIDAGKTFTFEKIEQSLYEGAGTGSKNTIEVHISTIRKKLKSHGVDCFIKTRRGFGYYVEK